MFSYQVRFEFVLIQIFFQALDYHNQHLIDYSLFDYEQVYFLNDLFHDSFQLIFFPYRQLSE